MRDAYAPDAYTRATLTKYYLNYLTINIMKKALLLTTLAASMAFGTATAQVALQQTQNPLYVQQALELQQAKAVDQAVKGIDANAQKPEAPFGLKPGESKTFQLGKKKHGLRAAELADGFKVYGTLMVNENWPVERFTDPATGESFEYQRSLYDVYTFDGNNFTATGYDQEDEYSRYIVSNGGGALVDGVYYYNYNQEFYGQLAYNIYGIYDLNNGTLKLTSLDETYADIAQQTAYDPTTGEIYGQFWSAKKDGYVWGIRNKKSGRTKAINAMYGYALRALAFDKLGRPWAINMNNELIMIDKLTGLYDVIGTVDIPLTNVIMTGAIDPKDEAFYFFGATQGQTEQSYLSHLYTIDLKTAKATLVKDLPGNALMAGAAFAPVVYAETVPAPAENLTLTFDKDALNGTVSFAAPSTTVGGAALSSSNVSVTLDGVVVKEVANATAGQNITFDVTVEKAGVHVIQVVATNAAGAGKPATASKYIGLDIPEVVKNLKLTQIDYNHAELSWDAPAKGIHGGYINPADVRYVVTNSDQQYEAENLAETHLAVGKEGTTLSVRSYGVLPYNLAGMGSLVASDRIYFGNPDTPNKTYEFLNEKGFKMWKVVDENEDGVTWNFDPMNYCAQIGYNKEQPCEDWFFSPPLHLNPDNYYDLVTNIGSKLTYYQEKFAIYLAKTQDVAGVDMKNPIRDVTATDLDKASGFDSKPAYYKFTDPFCVEEEGDYYIAYYCCSDANQLGLTLSKVQVNEGSSKLTPAAVTDLVMTAGERGVLEATATFTLPTTNTKGEPIDEITRVALYVGDEQVVTKKIGLEPGQPCTLVHTKASQGINKYVLYVYNDEGKGLPAYGEVYVGVDVPKGVTNSDVTVNNGQVFVNWEAPAGGKNGGYVDNSKLTYTVATQGNNDIIGLYQGSDLTCEDFTYQIAGDQYEQYYGIWAKNVAGESAGVATPSIIGGGSYKTPFYEDFSGNSDSHLWLIGYYENPTASVSVNETESHDASGYSIAVNANGMMGGKHHLTSGKITIGEGCKLTFAAKSTTANGKVKLAIAEDWVIQHVQEVKEFDCTKNEWGMMEYDLSAYAGKTIILDFTFQTTSRGTIYFDDVKIADANGISNLETEAAATNWYDLSGRRTKATNGVRISSDKKVLK